MKKIAFIFLFAASCLLGVAQNDEFRPSRTPEEEAEKQTEMLYRELNLTEQQRDTVYKIHLKYAKLRQISNTRAEGLQRLNDMTRELLAVMTENQQQAFLNKQVGPPPRRMQPVMIK